MKTVLVRQRDHMDCGVACIAMLAGKSYEWAAELAGSEYFRFGLKEGDIRTLLRANGVFLDTAWVTGWKPQGLWLALESYSEQVFHWVVIHDGVILDPSESRPMHVDEYAPGLMRIGGHIAKSWRVSSTQAELQRLQCELAESSNELLHARCCCLNDPISPTFNLPYLGNSTFFAPPSIKSCAPR